MRLGKKSLGALLVSATLFSATSAVAGGPLANCDDGVPFRWGNGGVGITFNPDQGSLGPLTNAEANALVDQSFQAWGDVDSSTATYVQGDLLPVDVDITNFGPYLEPVAPDGLSAIVYDDTGEIFDELFGPGSGILGFAGPEFVNFATCEILEGVSFLNGPTFTDSIAAEDVMVHEFGHFSNLAHVQVNGAILIGDNFGPDLNVFPVPDFSADIVETMYPFYFGSINNFGTRTLARDDIISLSSLYPAEGYADATVTISGQVTTPDGETRLSGVNVIARNIDDPYADATGILTGALTDASDPSISEFVGTYTINGLTPGASYLIYIDEIVDGGFSTPPVILAPSPEEFYSGDAESSSDDPLQAAFVSGAAGETITGIDVILNEPQPGDPLNTGPFGDDSTRLFTPFPILFCGEEYDSLWVNGNGNITFGGPDPDFSESAGDLLAGPPRIAGHWRDLNASLGGSVTFDTDNWSYFKIIWDGVPEFNEGGANTFSITLHRAFNKWAQVRGNRFDIQRGDMTAVEGLSGYSCGGAVANGFEEERNLSGRNWFFFPQTAVYEQFVAGAGEANDLSGKSSRFIGVPDFKDSFELRSYFADSSSQDNGFFWRRRGSSDNNTIEDATRIRAPFVNDRRFAELAEGDVDYYSMSVKEGDILAIEVARGQIDSIIGLFDADTGQLLAADDDGGDGLLSRGIFQIPFDVNVAIAVSSFPDFEFTGAGGSTGAYLLSVNKYRGEILQVGDEDSLPVNLPQGFPFQGEKYDSVNLNSNGNLTFVAPDPFGFIEGVDELLNGPPRIAALWDDLDPSGVFGNPGIYVVEQGKKSTSIHAVSVGEFFSSSPNYFSVELKKNGEIELDYGVTARSDALVGISEGGGAVDPGDSNLSRLRHVEATGTIYENFPEAGFFEAPTSETTPFTDFDLYFEDVEFEAPKDD